MSSKNAFNLIISKGISSLGSTLSAFMLNLWIFDKTSSYAIFILNTAIVSIIPLLFCIASGALADKIPKKIILLATDVITIPSLVLLVIITASQYFNFFLYVCMLVIIAIANEFRYTATTAFIPELASSDQLIRYNGLQQIFRGISVIADPILGAVSYEMINIGYSLFLSMFIQLTSLLILLKIPSSTTTATKTEQNQQGYYEAFYWLRSSKLLKVYLFSFCIINAICVSYMSIITPYILEVFDKKTLVLSSVFQGLGLLAVGLILGRLTNFCENFLYQGSIIATGISMLLVGILGKISLIFLAFLVGVGIGVMAATNQTVWQKHTPLRLQGRMVAIRTLGLYLFTPAFVYMTLPFTTHISGRVFSYTGGYAPLGITISVLGILLLLTAVVVHIGVRKYAL